MNGIGFAKPYFNDDVAGTAELVQAGRTVVYAYNMHNTTAADAFLLLYDAAAAASVTVGTTAPDYVIPAGANEIVQGQFPAGIAFANGLVIASTTATEGSTGAAQDVSLAISPNF